MTKENLVTAKEGTTLEEAKEILRHRKVEKLPIVDDEMHLKGLITIKDIEKAVAYPNAARDEGGRLLCGAAIGVTADLLDRVAALVEVGADVLCLDSAHGHAQGIIQAVSRIKALYPDVQLIAGNVATAEATEALIAGRRRLREGRHRPRLHLHHPCGRRYRRAPDHRCI